MDFTLLNDQQINLFCSCRVDVVPSLLPKVSMELNTIDEAAGQNIPASTFWRRGCLNHTWPSTPSLDYWQ